MPASTLPSQRMSCCEHRRHDGRLGEVFRGPVVQLAGRAVQIPLAGLRQALEHVFHVVPVGATGSIPANRVSGLRIHGIGRYVVARRPTRSGSAIRSTSGRQVPRHHSRLCQLRMCPSLNLNDVLFSASSRRYSPFAGSRDRCWRLPFTAELSEVPLPLLDVVNRADLDCALVRLPGRVDRPSAADHGCLAGIRDVRDGTVCRAAVLRLKDEGLGQVVSSTAYHDGHGMRPGGCFAFRREPRPARGRAWQTARLACPHSDWAMCQTRNHCRPRPRRRLLEERRP